MKFGTGELLLIGILAFVLIFTLFIILNNLKYKHKQANIEKQKKAKDVQPIADISPVSVEKQKSKDIEVPLDVNDPIFDKKKYENITDRATLKELIDDEKSKENKDIIDKLQNIEITSEEVEGEALNVFDDVDNDSSDDDLIIDVNSSKFEGNVNIGKTVEINENNNVKQLDNQKENSSTINTVDVIKMMIEKEKKNN